MADEPAPSRCLVSTAEETTSLLHQLTDQDAVVIEMENLSEPAPQLQTVADEFSPTIASVSAGGKQDSDFDSGSSRTSSRAVGNCKIATTPSSVHSDSGTRLLTNSGTGLEVQFCVGQERQLMVGAVHELAVVSRVFEAMFCDRWRKGGDTVIEVDIPDVGTTAFAVILRYAAQDTDLDLTEDTVWDVLKAADKYQVLPLVRRCFHFLLHKHRRRHSSHHLCTVMETAHRLNYSDHHAECMQMAKLRAGKIFKNKTGLAELCQDCMLDLVMADDLHQNVAENLVHGAVITWARCACAKRGVAEPGWIELRAAAGNLVYQVRYLAMPRHTLKSLSAGQPSFCLLTKQELTRLMNGDASEFPKTVNRKRGQSREDGLTNNVLRHTSLDPERRTQLVVSVVFLIGLLLLLVFVIVYFPIAVVLDPSPSSD